MIVDGYLYCPTCQGIMAYIGLAEAVYTTVCCRKCQKSYRVEVEDGQIQKIEEVK